VRRNPDLIVLDAICRSSKPFPYQISYIKLAKPKFPGIFSDVLPGNRNGRSPYEKLASLCVWSDLTSLTRISILFIMSDDSYSVYQAKAHFSELLRKVQANKRVFITSRGKPIAAIVPLARSNEGLEARLERLEEEGTVSRDAAPLDHLVPIVKRKGALARFLAERD